MDVILKYFPTLDAIQRERYAALDALYHEWNARINVISRKDIDNLYLHHVLHSLAIAEFVRFKPQTSIMDLGTGGGFPGIPLAIMFPECHFHLVDSTAKKIRVCDEVIQALGLENVSTQWTRLCDLTRLVRNNISSEQFNAIPNGLVCLKGGELEHEVMPMKHHTLVTPLSDYFSEDYFQTKKVVYTSL